MILFYWLQLSSFHCIFLVMETRENCKKSSWVNRVEVLGQWFVCQELPLRKGVYKCTWTSMVQALVQRLSYRNKLPVDNPLDAQKHHNSDFGLGHDFSGLGKGVFSATNSGILFLGHTGRVRSHLLQWFCSTDHSLLTEHVLEAQNKPASSLSFHSILRFLGPSWHTPFSHWDFQLKLT
jgi:hypothetical protein